MFKIGEKVICIDNTVALELELNKEYTIKDISQGRGENNIAIFVILEDWYNYTYMQERFISLKELRKNKLKEIKKIKKCLK